MLYTPSINSVASRLRRQVSLWIGDSPDLSDHLVWLVQNGFSREDSRQLRYTVEVFYQCEPGFTIARAASLIHSNSSLSFGFHDHFLSDKAKAGVLQMHADLFGMSKGISNKSETHPFFKALGAWPRYAERLEQECLRWNAYVGLVTSTTCEAQALAGRMSTLQTTINYSNCAPESLIASAEVVVIASALRRMFINAELDARVSPKTDNNNIYDKSVSV